MRVGRAECHFIVDAGHRALQKIVIEDIVSALRDIVGRLEYGKVGGKGIEDRRYGRESVATAGEVNVFLAQSQKQRLHEVAVGRSDISFDVVEDQESVNKVLEYDVESVVASLVAYYAAGSLVCAYAFPVARMHHGDIQPFVLVRRHYQGPASGGQTAAQYLPENGRLAGTWGADKDDLEHLPCVGRLIYFLQRRFCAGARFQVL